VAGMILKFADELEPGDMVNAIVDGMLIDGWQSREALKAGCIVATVVVCSPWENSTEVVDVTCTSGHVTRPWPYSLVAVCVQDKRNATQTINAVGKRGEA